jgi:hypothetical protein
MTYDNETIEKVFDVIVKRIEQGESLRSVLRDDNMPSSRTFYEWSDDNEKMQKRYARATELRAETIFDEIFEISDESENDIIITDDGRELTNHEVISRSRLRVDTRKWALAKMNPKKYGDKTDLNLNHSGEIDITPKEWV